MLFSNILRIFLCTLLTLLLVRCANVRLPEGGKKDLTPPKLKESLPKNKTTNFTGQKIVLTFNERVSAKELKKELIIAPIINGGYQIQERKNQITLVFDSAFQANTTYTLNFRKGIEDLTEKNKAKDLQLTFSTGPGLDSVYLAGRVTHLLTGQAQKNTSVLLYAETDTFDIAKSKPMYITRTTDEGVFNLTNLKKGTYRLYALVEKDDNLRFGQLGELLGYYPQIIQVDSSQTGLDIQVYPFDPRKLTIRKPKRMRNQIEIEFSKGIRQYEIQWDNPAAAQDVLTRLDDDRLLFYHLRTSETDSLSLQLSVTDSSGQRLSQRTKIRFAAADPKIKPAAFLFRSTPKAGEAMIPQKAFDWQLVFNKPVASFLQDSLRLATAKDTSALHQHVQFNADFSAATIQGLSIKQTTQLLIAKGAFISAEGDSLAPASISLGVRAPEDYGILRGKVKTTATQYRLQVLDDKFEVEQELINPKTFVFEYLKPGQKKLRVLIDLNQNGQWDPGNYTSLTPHEPVYHYPEAILLKANWEINDIELIFD